MSIETFLDVDGRRCLLVDSVTELALPMVAFASLEDAESFADWCIAVHGDPRRFDAQVLTYLRNAWHDQPKCPDCRRVLDDEGRCGECGDELSEERTG